MKLSKDARKSAKQCFRTSLVDGHLDAGRVRQISGQLMAKKPRSYLGILKEFHRLLRLEIARHHALVESAIPLPAETVDRVTNDLRARVGADLTTEFKIAPELLGGMRVRIGSDVYDGSVLGRLQLLERNLAS